MGALHKLPFLHLNYLLFSRQDCILQTCFLLHCISLSFFSLIIKWNYFSFQEVPVLILMLVVMYVTLRRLSLKQNILTRPFCKQSWFLFGTDVIFQLPYIMLPNNIKCFTHYLLFSTQLLLKHFVVHPHFYH